VLPLKIKRSENRLDVVPLQRKFYALLWEEFVIVSFRKDHEMGKLLTHSFYDLP